MWPAAGLARSSSVPARRPAGPPRAPPAPAPASSRATPGQPARGTPPHPPQPFLAVLPAVFSGVSGGVPFLSGYCGPRFRFRVGLRVALAPGLQERRLRLVAGIGPGAIRFWGWRRVFPR